MNEEGGNWNWPEALAFISCGGIGGLAIHVVSEFLGFGTLGDLFLWIVFGAVMGASSVLLHRAR